VNFFCHRVSSCRITSQSHHLVFFFHLVAVFRFLVAVDSREITSPMASMHRQIPVTSVPIKQAHLAWFKIHVFILPALEQHAS